MFSMLPQKRKNI